MVVESASVNDQSSQEQGTEWMPEIELRSLSNLILSYQPSTVGLTLVKSVRLTALEDY